MLKTGKINPITGEEILKAELKDVAWEKEWSELTDEEKVVYLSYQGIGFLNEDNKQFVIDSYNATRVWGEMIKSEILIMEKIDEQLTY